MEPRHLAIIMDGNGRWAESRGLPRSEGHRAGAEAARRITAAVRRRGIPFLTLYALSTENLYRPQSELDALARLLREFLRSEVDKMIAQGIRLRVLGDRSALPADLRRQVGMAERDTEVEAEMTLCLAVAYGGRDEIVRAVRKLARQGGLERLSEDRLASALDTNGLPDPDLVIRTGGQMRLSNFLPWQSAYSELYFSRVLWPDFNRRCLSAALAAYRCRERRFGRTAPAPKGVLR